MAYEILVVDDEADIRNLIADILSDEGYTVTLAKDGATAIEAIKARRPNLVILDVWLNDSRFDGIELLDIVKSDHPMVPVIMISGHGTIETAVQTLKKGAYDFIEKPFSVERLITVVKRALEAAGLKRENEDLRGHALVCEEFLGTSTSAQNLRLSLGRLGPTNSRILIEGPVGSGRQFFARLLHRNSLRSEGPFIAFDCRGHTFVEVEEKLLGKDGDPSTPLSPSAVGLLEQAQNGTLYLEHVDALPFEFQTKLARILHDMRLTRVNGRQAHKIDVRILSSTACDMASLIKQGHFREELFYRLGVVQVTLPSLSERVEDIWILADYFLKFYSHRRYQKLTLESLTRDLKDRLLSYKWPGNIRQLRNVMEWLSIVTQDEKDVSVTVHELPWDLFSKESNSVSVQADQSCLDLTLREAREIFERQYLASQIMRFGGNVSKTADFIQMERSALHRKLRSLGLYGGAESK